MAYSRSSLAAAEREASSLTVEAQRAGLPYRYRAQRYPNGIHSTVEAWPWGVYRFELGYHKDGSERGAGFVFNDKLGGL